MSGGPKWRAANGKTYTHPHREGVFAGMTTLLSNGVPQFLDNWHKLKVAEYAVDHVDEWRHLERDVAVKVVKTASDRHRDRAGDAGTIVHEWIEDMLSGKSPNTTLVDDERALSRLPSVRNFVRDWRPKPVALERTAYNLRLNYAGTFDFLGTFEAAPELGLVIADWKTGNYIGIKEGLQQIGYATADHYLADDDSEVPMPKVDSLLLVQIGEPGVLSDTGYRVHRVRFDDETVALLDHVVVVAKAVSVGPKFVVPGDLVLEAKAEPTGVLDTSSACGSCGSPIYFAHAAEAIDGRRAVMPLDVEPVADGNVVVDEHGRYTVLGKGDEPDTPFRYVSHFATCASASKHRKSKAKAAKAKSEPTPEPTSSPADESDGDVFDGLARTDVADAVPRAKSARIDAVKEAFPGAAEQTDDGAFEAQEAERDELRASLVRRIRRLPADARKKMAAFWPENVPTLKASDAHTLAELAAIDEVLVKIEREYEMPFDPPPARHEPNPKFTPQPRPEQPTPDTASEAEHDFVIGVLKTLDEAELARIQPTLKSRGVPNLRRYTATRDQLLDVLKLALTDRLEETVELDTDEANAFIAHIGEPPTLEGIAATLDAARRIGDDYLLVTDESGTPVWSTRDDAAG